MKLPNLVQTSQAPRHPDDATADQEGVSEKDLVALRRALTRRFWMLPNPFLKRPSGSQAHAYQSHEADFDAMSRLLQCAAQRSYRWIGSITGLHVNANGATVVIPLQC